MTTIGIVGAEEIKWTESQKTMAKWWIETIILNARKGIMVLPKPTSTDSKCYITDTKLLKGKTTIASGHCPRGGIDMWVEVRAKMMGLKTAIYPPDYDTWLYYKLRNIDIADNSDIIIDIEPAGNFGGGTWTYNYFKRKYPNKIAIRIVVD